MKTKLKYTDLKTILTNIKQKEEECFQLIATFKLFVIRKIIEEYFHIAILPIN